MYWFGVMFAEAFAVNRFSRIGVANTPSWLGKRPSVFTDCVVSCCVRS